MKNGTGFLESVQHMKWWSASVFFENNKYHLDEEVLQVNQMMKGEGNVDIGRAMPIVQPIIIDVDSVEV